MARLLIVHHTASPATQELLESVLAGGREVEDVDILTAPALNTGPAEVLAADGLILGTPANIGYMSGALKHFFDTVYYPCLQDTVGKPYGLYVHGNNDTGGAVRAVESIADGLKWKRVRPPVTVIGKPTKDDLEACWELGGVLAATLAG